MSVSANDAISVRLTKYDATKFYNYLNNCINSFEPVIYDLEKIKLAWENKDKLNEVAKQFPWIPDSLFHDEIEVLRLLDLNNNMVRIMYSIILQGGIDAIETLINANGQTVHVVTQTFTLDVEDSILLCQFLKQEYERCKNGTITRIIGDILQQETGKEYTIDPDDGTIV